MVFKYNKFIKFIALSIVLLITSAGCMNAAQNPPEGGQTTGTSAGQTTGASAGQTTGTPGAQTSQTTAAAKTQEEQFTNELLKEPEVKSGKVSLQDDIVACAMVIKEDANTQNAKKLAQKYADKLKAAYKGKQINVQAVQKGKNIANIDA